MIAILLVALFTAVALTSAITLADAAVRSRNAVRLLRGDLVRIDQVRSVIVRFEESFAEDNAARMPALRPVSAVRASQRRLSRSPARLCAAA